MANAALRYGGQGILYLLFAAFIGYFSTAPAYQHLAPDHALLRLSFRHPGQFITDCRARSAEELAKLPPQLRAQMDCPRERSPVHVRVELDGEHALRVQFNDDARVKGPTHVGDRRLAVVPGQVVLIDFIADQGGVVIR